MILFFSQSVPVTEEYRKAVRLKIVKITKRPFAATCKLITPRALRHSYLQYPLTNVSIVSFFHYNIANNTRVGTRSEYLRYRVSGFICGSIKSYMKIETLGIYRTVTAVLGYVSREKFREITGEIFRAVMDGTIAFIQHIHRYLYTL